MTRTLEQIDKDLDVFWATVGKAKGDGHERLMVWRDKLEYERIDVEKAQDLARAMEIRNREAATRDRLLQERDDRTKQNSKFERPAHHRGSGGPGPRDLGGTIGDLRGQVEQGNKSAPHRLFLRLRRQNPQGLPVGKRKV